MSNTQPGWGTQGDAFAVRCPRPTYARLVLSVCDAAERLVGSVLRRSFDGEREETLRHLRILENAKAPSDLNDEDREVLTGLAHALGSSDRDRKKGDPDSYVPRRGYGMLWNLTATFIPQDPSLNTAPIDGDLDGPATEDVALGQMEEAVLAAVKRAREHFSRTAEPKKSKKQPAAV